jgi:hypothetical protein
MTIEHLTREIIQGITEFPEEARQSQDGFGPKTCWDEYKEQIQYEEYDSFEIFEETIDSMVRHEVSELSDTVIDKIYRTLYKNYYPTDLYEKRKDIVASILSRINQEANSQEIEYNKPDSYFIRYYVDDLIIVAEVLEQVSPEEFSICAYSEATGPSREQGVSSLSCLEEENGLERIGLEEFEQMKKIHCEK